MKAYLSITKNWAPLICGVSDYTYFLAKELQKMGHKVHIVTSSQDRLERTEFEMHPVIKRLSVFKVFTLLKHIKRTGTDVINLQYVPQMTDRFGISPSIALFAMIVRIFLKQKLVITMHELFIPFGRPSLWPIAILQRLYLFIIALSGHSIVVTTSKRRDYLARFFPEKTSLIPVGSNIPVAEISKEERQSLRREYLGDAKYLLASFGTASRGKDYVFLLDLIREMNANSCFSKLLLIGDIERDQKIFRAIKEKIDSDGLRGQVVLTGKIRATEISRLLSIADIFVVKQRNGVSTGSGTLISAMAHRLLIVANDEDGIDETLRKDLILKDMAEPGKTAMEIIKILKSGNTEEIRINSYNNYKDKFAWDAIAKEFSGLFP